MSARLPLLPLGLALALALAVRLPLMTAPLQVDEFNTLFEIASRRTAASDRLPGADDPLRLVASAAEVRERAVLPYGVRNPLPLYPLALRVLVRPFPLAEWSLRLPSLVAGLATVVALAALALRIAGPEAAVASGFLAALDPTLVVTSVTARPYAAAGLAIAISFLLHPAVAAFAGTRRLGAHALGYGLMLALTAYLNPVLVVVAIAHAVVATLPLTHWWERRPPANVRVSAAWGTGGGLAFLLTLPLIPYLRMIGDVRHTWKAYLSSPADLLGFSFRPLFLFEHNLAVLLLLFACALPLAASRLRRPLPGADASATPIGDGAPSPPGPGSRVAMLVGASWLLAPQVAAIALNLATDGGLLLDRYLFYTTPGGVLLVAGLIASRGSARARRETVLLCAAALFMLVGIRGLLGYNRMTDRFPVAAIRALTGLDALGVWQDDDVLLFHSALLEADLPPEAVPQHVLAPLRQTFLAPLSSLYVAARPRNALALSRSIPCGTPGGSWIVRPHAVPERLYDGRLADSLRVHSRWWLLSLAGENSAYLPCLLPWLTAALGSDLTVTVRSLDRPERPSVTLRATPQTQPLEITNAVGHGGAFLALIERAPR